MGFRLGPGGSAVRSATAPWRWALVAAVLFGGMIIGWLGAHGIFRSPGPGAPADLPIDPRPVIISLQEIGELHTIKVNLKDVLRVASDRPAEGWMHEVPGGDAVSRWATHNEALIVATGSVEAGIDLRRITASDVTTVRMPDGTQGLRVRLPKPEVYTPSVAVRVEHTDSGLLWKDENLIPKAEIEASKRFLDAAEKDGIRQHARDNALQQMKQMHNLFGNNHIEFYF